MRGWIKLHRQIVNSDIYVMPPLYLRVFERLIIEANHADKEIPYKYPGESVTTKKLIKRGERLTSLRQICGWVGWYERGVFKEPNVRTVREILRWLVDNSMIEIYPNESNSQGTHYKVLNYEVYQSEEPAKVTVSKQSVNSQYTVTTTKQECIRMNKNDKEVKDRPKKSKDFSVDSEPYRLALHLKKEILKQDPKTKTPDNLQKWALIADRMIRLDKRDPQEAANLITWAQNDDFWKSNILSMDKFRKQYDKLRLQSTTRKQELIMTKDKEYTPPKQDKSFFSFLDEED